MLSNQVIQIHQQLTESFPIDFMMPDGVTPRDLSGLLFKMDCRPDPSSETLYFSLSSSDGSLVVDSTDKHRLYINFSHQLTKELNFDKGVFDLIGYKSDFSEVELMMSGIITLAKLATKID